MKITDEVRKDQCQRRQRTSWRPAAGVGAVSSLSGPDMPSMSGGLWSRRPQRSGPRRARWRLDLLEIW